ncbi:NmrA family NAD(P)-binding protein [Streptomyces sp. NPDC046371]|uniref:NmrA family NAD(P)-binding protein n=1 Tax=Streptomyces sp. NPDC046371 TaxID=3154916 RepID=UPI0033C387F2
MSGQIPMRVTVVGATGFHGGAVARLPAERQHRVRTLTRRPEGDRPPLPGAEFVAGELGSPADVRRLFEGATHAFWSGSGVGGRRRHGGAARVLLTAREPKHMKPSGDRSHGPGPGGTGPVRQGRGRFLVRDVFLPVRLRPSS